MKKIIFSDSWPASWKQAYKYDLLEIYPGRDSPGYRYAYANRREKTLAMVQRTLPPGSTVLDLAASQGNFSVALADMGYNVTWNDLRRDLVDYVKLKDDSHRIKYVPGNALEISFPELFDGVLITEIIEHVAYPNEFLKKVAKIVRIGGYIYLTTPNGRYFRNPLPRFSDFSDPSVFETEQFKPDGDGHIFLLYEDELRQFAESSGLSVVSYDTFTSPLTNGQLKTSRILSKIPKNLVLALENSSSYLPRTVAKRMHVHSSALLRRTV